MSLNTETQKLLAEHVAKDPLWVAMASGDGSVEISGPLEDTMQALVNTLMAATNGLMAAVVHLADAVDDLRREIGTNENGD